MISPSFHRFLEGWEVTWRFILCNVFSHLSYIPKVSPLSIERRRIGSISLMIILEVVDYIVVITCFLSVFWSGTDLEVILREDVRNRLACIKFSWSFGEKMLHLIYKLIVLIDIDTWVFDDQAPVFVKSLSDCLAIFCVISGLFEEVWDINHRYYWLAE